MNKICLVIACWSGLRRFMYTPTIHDRAYFLKKHVYLLSTLKHNLDTVIFVNSENPLEPKEYTDYLSNIPDYLGTAKVIKYQRENIGMSYGAWSKVYDIHNSEFDYYLTFEDDYFFVQDNFDQILIDELERQGSDCALVCSHVGGPPNYLLHAAVPMGIVRGAAMARVVALKGQLPHSESSNEYTSNEAGQVAYGHSFIEAGYRIEDFRHKYRCYLSMLGNVNCIYPENTEDLITPCQVADRDYSHI